VVLTILKNMKVSWDDYSQYMKNNKLFKPSTNLEKHWKMMDKMVNMTKHPGQIMDTNCDFTMKNE